MRKSPLFLIAFLFLLGQSQADNTTPEGPAEQPGMTAEQRSAYERPLRNPYVLHLRKALNGYLDGTNVEDTCTACVVKYKCGGVPSSLDCFSKDYFKSKFVVVQMSKALGGGKTLSIIFQDKPDKLFVAWVYPYRGSGTFDLRGFWQNSRYDKEAMEAIRKALNISQLPAL